MMISLLLASYIATHNGYAKRPLNHGQARRRAHQIVQMLKKEDPVLDILMDNAGIPKDAR